MLRSQSCFCALLVLFFAAFLPGAVSLAGPPSTAEEARPGIPDDVSRPSAPFQQYLWPQPNQPEQSKALTRTDEFAVLDAVHTTLTELSDGATYVWRRAHGRLSAIVKPTATFRDRTGRVCRHIQMQLTSDDHSRRVEGMACRSKDGVWLLEG